MSELYNRDQYFECLKYQSSTLTINNSSCNAHTTSLINHDLAYKPDGLLDQPLESNHTKMFFTIGSQDYITTKDSAMMDIRRTRAKSKEVFINPGLGHCPLRFMSGVLELYRHIFGDDGSDGDMGKEVSGYRKFYTDADGTLYWTPNDSQGCFTYRA